MPTKNESPRMVEIHNELLAIQKERHSMIWDNGGFAKFPHTMKAIDQRINKLQDLYAYHAMRQAKES